MNVRNQQVIINLKATSKGYIVTESSADAPTLISFPKNVIYGNQQPPQRSTRGRIPNQRTLQALSQELANKKPMVSQQNETTFKAPEKQVNNFDKKVDQNSNGKYIQSSQDSRRRLEIQQQPAKTAENQKQLPLINSNVVQNVQEPAVENNQVLNQQKIVSNYKENFLKQFEHQLPATTRWFNMNKIHQIEKDSIPEFFPQYYSCNEGQICTNFKNPTSYFQIRNAIIERYLKNPRVHLRILECLQYIPGDISAIIRIYTFLEHWGIINYQVNPANLQVQGNLYQYSQGQWERIKFNFSQETPQNMAANNNTKCKICNKFCDVTYKQKKESMVKFQDWLFLLCQNCFQNGDYPSYLKADDFDIVQVEKKRHEQWNQEENLKLLELVYKYQENWNEIKKHFQNKSVEDIISQYLQMAVLKISDVSFMEEPEQNQIALKDSNQQFFGNDNSNVILQYLAAFKINLDTIEGQGGQRNANMTEMKRPDNTSTSSYRIIESMIQTQISKIDETLSFLEDYEKNVHNEKLNLNDQYRTNIQMQIECGEMKENQ